jgi:hypothetical protein
VARLSLARLVPCLAHNKKTTVDLQRAFKNNHLLIFAEMALSLQYTNSYFLRILINTGLMRYVVVKKWLNLDFET